MTDGAVLLDAHGKIQLVNDAVRPSASVPGSAQGQTLLEAFALPDLAALAERLQQEGSIIGFEIELVEGLCLSLEATQRRPEYLRRLLRGHLCVP